MVEMQGELCLDVFAWHPSFRERAGGDSKLARPDACKLLVEFFHLILSRNGGISHMKVWGQEKLPLPLLCVLSVVVLA